MTLGPLDKRGSQFIYRDRGVNRARIPTLGEHVLHDAVEVAYAFQIGGAYGGTVVMVAAALAIEHEQARHNAVTRQGRCA